MIVYIIFIYILFVIFKKKSHHTNISNKKYYTLIDNLRQYKYLNPILFNIIERNIHKFFNEINYYKCKKYYDNILTSCHDLKLHIENDLYKETKLINIIDSLEMYMDRYINIIILNKNTNDAMYYGFNHYQLLI